MYIMPMCLIRFIHSYIIWGSIKSTFHILPWLAEMVQPYSAWLRVTGYRLTCCVSWLPLPAPLGREQASAGAWGLFL